MGNDDGLCSICGKKTSTCCKQCKCTFYCCVEHQKADWKKHKQICFPPDSVCVRCDEKIVFGSQCKVPHPDHLQTGMGGSYGPDGVASNFSCEACGASYTKSSPDIHMPESQRPVTNGPEYCFFGNHTVKPLPADDDRRVRNDVVSLRSGPDLQEKINALDGNTKVKILKISSEGMFDDTGTVLDIKLPNLEELTLIDVEMSSLKLDTTKTPKVRKLYMQNPTQEDNPDFWISLPELREFTCHYWGPGNDNWLNRMLDSAKKLEVFDSYKLRAEVLGMYSNTLRSIRLHRAECLRYLELWAPCLTRLDVQACYDLENIRFLGDHKLKAELPRNFDFGPELHVNAINACLGDAAMSALVNHPRVRRPIETEDDDDGNPFRNPCESALRNLMMQMGHG